MHNITCSSYQQTQNEQYGDIVPTTFSPNCFLLYHIWYCRQY